jgi:hypothetical protein
MYFGLFEAEVMKEQEQNKINRLMNKNEAKCII